MVRRPPKSTRTTTPFPYTSPCRAGVLPVAARLQFLAVIAARCVLGDQRGAVAHVVLPILRVEGLHRAGLVLSRLVLADKLRERRADFRLAALDLHRLQHLQFLF